VELVPVAGAEEPAAGPSVEALTGTVEALVGTTEVPPSPQGRGSEDSPI
jgi:hypothetical protein